MSRLNDLSNLGQAVWYDNLRRGLLTSGELQKLLDAGVRGVTSNPTILERAIAGSTDYDDALHTLVDEGVSNEGIYEALVFEDIRRTADLLAPIYEATGGADGFVSLEVSPHLAHDEAATIAAAKRYVAALNRPNVMIKVPATPAGMGAVEHLVGAGVSVNVTLVFSQHQYEAVAEAYLSGLEHLVKQGGDPTQVASVASVFVSRIDTVVDAQLDKRGDDRAERLRGAAAIANAKLIYASFERLFSGSRWARLAQQGAKVQRPLWASTGVKDPLYPDTYYADALIGAHTVNTMPPKALQAFRERGTVRATLSGGLEQAEQDLADLDTVGIDLGHVTHTLLHEGLASFNDSFDALLRSVDDKREAILRGEQRYEAALGRYEKRVQAGLEASARADVAARIWRHDYTLWDENPAEISNRLGWLHIADVMQANLDRLEAFAGEVREAGYDHAVLLGMGGSSLAPEMFAKVFGTRAGYPTLDVLDTTDADAVQRMAAGLELDKTLFVVSSKSGSTTEALSFFKYFYNQVKDAVGEEAAGAHFAAVTDPGSGLAELAETYGFRRTFLNDPNIGGRYSALSYFGLVPAALLGVDLAGLLKRALIAAAACDACVRLPDNPGLWLGVALGELAKRGRDKATFVLSPGIESFGDWLEQLIAESTGKLGVGILPVVGESLGTPEVYGDDRVFIALQLGDDRAFDDRLGALERTGHPVIRLHVHDALDLGRHIFLWEFATAVAGYRLGINPFDQPNVESAKVQAREMVRVYQETGELPSGAAATLDAATLQTFVDAAKPGDYLSLQAFVTPSAETTAALRQLRHTLRDQTRLAVTVGYGPRYLHSTGQLHKGGGAGHFIQLVSPPADDVLIPDEAGAAHGTLSFDTLKRAQVLGDKRALEEVGQRVLHLHTSAEVAEDLETLSGALSRALSTPAATPAD